MTVSIDRSSAPETQNRCTIAWDTMLGEMYVPVASFTIRAISSVGPTRYPTRIPGQTVFENEDA